MIGVSTAVGFMSKGLFKNSWEMIGASFRTLLYLLCSSIYSLISFVYNMFLTMAYGELLNNDTVLDLFSRVGILLGLIMSVRVAISFIQLLIDPDSIKDKEKGINGIVKKIIIVTVLLGTSNYFFTVLRNVQTLVIKKDVIPNILLPKKVNTKNFGFRLSGELFLAFVVPVTVDPLTIDKVNSDLISLNPFALIHDLKGQACNENYIEKATANLKRNGDYVSLGGCINAIGTLDGEEINIINFNWFFCVAVGLCVLWLLLSYCLNLGIRTFQLAVLQIISPFAIIGYLSPKTENTFTRWLKVYFSTYVDVFIRVATLNFFSYLMVLLFQENEYWNSIGIKSDQIIEKGYIKVMMCLALLSFAKKLPEILKEIFPSTGGSGLNLGMEKASSFAPAGMALGATVGMALGVGTGAATHYKANKAAGKSGWQLFGATALGGLTGGARGANAGRKNGNPITGISAGLQANRQANNTYNERLLAGGSTLGTFTAMLGDMFGESAGQRDARLLNNYNAVDEAYDDLTKMAEETDVYQEANRSLEAYIHSSGASDTEILKRQKGLKDLRDQIINAGLEGKSLKIADSSKIWENDGTIKTANGGSAEDQSRAGRMQNRGEEYNTFAQARGVELTGRRKYKNAKGEVFNDDSPTTKLKTVDDFKATREDNHRRANTILSGRNYQRNKVNDQYAGNNTNKNNK